MFNSRGFAASILCSLLLLACSSQPTRTPLEEAPADLELYDVVWKSPSADASGSMPIGNGELGLNAWAESGGDLVFYLSRTDAWSEASRLLKLGRIRLHVEPNPFADGRTFEQRLMLRDGRIAIHAGPAGDSIDLELFVDAEHDNVHVSARSDHPVRASATLECWRNEPRRLMGTELESSWIMRDAPDSVEVVESPDLLLDEAGTVAWYHRNERSVQPLTLEHQGLSSVAKLARDPLLKRTFGGWMAGKNFARARGRVLETRGAVTEFELTIATACLQCDDVGTWIEAVRESWNRAALASARADTSRWWHAFWSRSWVFVEGDPWPGSDHSSDPRPPSRITQAYLLQRWVQACGGRGHFPIKFNGSIFTVEPKFAGGPDLNPDWRRWGDSYWWQNTRLAYHAMLAGADYDMIAPLFDFYVDALPLCAARAKLYYGASGVYFPETMTILGTYSNGDYGWERSEHAVNEVLCPYWQWAWNQGPELVALGLDVFEHTHDRKFLAQKVLPIARATLEWFDTRFKRDAKGVLVISPTQVLETYWTGVVNDLPCVVGLHEIVQRLMALDGASLTPEDRALILRVKNSLPPIPTAATPDGGLVLAPAEKFDPARSNCESPELYALFPFRLARRDTPLFEAARIAYEKRQDRFTNGWPQDGQDAALLGKLEDARANLLAKVANSAASYRFPTMWGPNFDWLPDQCHGSNLMLTLQLMLLQEDSSGRQLFPCWPADWSVRFKLAHRDGSPAYGVKLVVR